MIASIFFTAPKLELAHQMASNPIQMTESEQRIFTRLCIQGESMMDCLRIIIHHMIFLIIRGDIGARMTKDERSAPCY
jgi:hypothetical protein